MEIRTSGRTLTSFGSTVIGKGEKGVDQAVVRRDFINLICEGSDIVWRFSGEGAIYRKQHLKGMVNRDRKINKK